MAIRFRKRVKILPGVHVNIGKRGLSTSFGPRGASVTVSSKRTTTSLGIPGTGLSHVSTTTRGSRRQAAAPQQPTQHSVRRILELLAVFLGALAVPAVIAWLFG